MKGFIAWVDLVGMAGGDLVVLYLPTGIEHVAFKLLGELFPEGASLPPMVPVDKEDVDGKDAKELPFKKVLVASAKVNINGAIQIPPPSAPTPLDFCFAVWRNAFPDAHPSVFQERVLGIIQKYFQKFSEFCYVVEVDEL